MPYYCVNCGEKEEFSRWQRYSLTRDDIAFFDKNGEFLDKDYGNEDNCEIIDEGSMECQHCHNEVEEYTQAEIDAFERERAADGPPEIDRPAMWITDDIVEPQIIRPTDAGTGEERPKKINWKEEIENHNA